MDSFGDARVAELRLLSWVAQHDEVDVPSPAPGPWHDLLIALVSSDLLTTFSYQQGLEYHISHGSSSTRLASQTGIRGESLLERYDVIARTTALERLHRGENNSFRITHHGRVRLSELKQALRSGREREPFGILWDVRHWRQDLQVAD
jgi:hypothetical protein